MARHLKWPPELGSNGSFLVLEQDSDDEIRRSAGLLCEVRPGQLPWWPKDFGTPSPLGTNDPEAAAELIEAALADLEPRSPLRVVVIDDGENPRHLHLSIPADGTP